MTRGGITKPSAAITIGPMEMPKRNRPINAPSATAPMRSRRYSAGVMLSPAREVFGQRWTAADAPPLAQVLGRRAQEPFHELPRRRPRSGLDVVSACALLADAVQAPEEHGDGRRHGHRDGQQAGEVHFLGP